MLSTSTMEAAMDHPLSFDDGSASTPPPPEQQEEGEHTATPPPPEPEWEHQEEEEEEEERAEPASARLLPSQQQQQHEDEEEPPENASVDDSRSSHDAAHDDDDAVAAARSDADGADASEDPAAPSPDSAESASTSPPGVATGGAARRSLTGDGGAGDSSSGSTGTGTGRRYPDAIDGLSLRVRGLQTALCSISSASLGPNLADNVDGDAFGGAGGVIRGAHSWGGGGGGGNVNGGGGSGDRFGGVFRNGSMDLLRTAVNRHHPNHQRRPRQARKSSMESSSCPSMDGENGSAASASSAAQLLRGEASAMRFADGASFLVSALCGLADKVWRSTASASISAPPPSDADGLWEHTSNVDTALCGIGPILAAVSGTSSECASGADRVVLRKLDRMSRLLDGLSETVGRISENAAKGGPWSAGLECCFGTLAELLCLMCIQTIRRACSVEGGRCGDDCSSHASHGGNGKRNTKVLQEEEEESVQWQISDALVQTWSGEAGQEDKLKVLCGSDDWRGIARNCEVDSDLFLEVSLLVLSGLEWAPRGVCDAMEKDQRRRGFLARIQKDDFADLYAAQTLLYLGNVHASMEQYEQALSHYEEALDIRQDNLGDDHYQVADVHKSIGNAHYLLGRNDRADAHYSEAIASLERGGVDCPDADDTLISLLLLRGNLKSQQGETDEAISMLSICLEIQVAALGECHPEVADTFRKRADLYLDVNRDAEALEDFWSVQKIRKEQLGADDPAVGDTFHDMGMLLWDRGEAEAALEMLSEALWIRQRAAPSPRHDDDGSSTSTSTSAEYYRNDAELARAETQAAIASIHRKTGRTEAAVQMYEGCLSIWRRELGDESDKVADARVALGHSNVDLGNVAVARGHYLAGLAVLERVLSRSKGGRGGGDDGEDERRRDRLTQLVFFLAKLELRDGNAEPAREYLERFVRLKRTAGRARDEECVYAMRMLAKMYRDEANKNRPSKTTASDKSSPESNKSSSGMGTGVLFNKMLSSSSLMGEKSKGGGRSIRDFKISLPGRMNVSSSLRTVSTASTAASSASVFSFSKN